VAGIPRRAAGYLVAALGVAAATAVLAPFHATINNTTVALAFLLVVLLVATVRGSGPALVASALGVAAFNFFFLPPLYTFTVADPQNWVALVAFLVTAVTAGELSARARRRAAEAEAERREARHAEGEVRRLAQLQTVVADLGLRALRADRCEDVLADAVTLVARTLDVEYANVMELLPGGEHLVLRAGVGWRDGAVGHATVESRGSQPGFTVRTEQPVIVEDAAAETRFVPLPRLLGEEVTSAMSVVIPTSEGPYGALGAHTRRRRRFIPDEVSFLQAVANVLGTTLERQRAEAALRESEATLKRAQEVAHIGSWSLDVPGNRLTWSEEVFRIFGVPAGTALTYEDFLGAVHPGDRASVERAWTAALDGARYDIEHRILVAGDLKWVRERAVVEFDEAGHALRGIGTVQDITERKRAEKELLRLNRAYRALSRCNEALIRATDESAWLEQVCRIIVDEAGYRFCWVGRAERDDARTVTPIARAGIEDGYLAMARITWADTERGRGPTGTCIRTREVQISTDVAADPRLAPWRAEALRRGYASSVAIPLVADGETYGALTIYAAETAAFGDAEVMLLRELAADLGYGVGVLRTRVERARAEDEIRQLNAELEQRVIARTVELEAANRAKDEVILREQAALAELRAAREREGTIGSRIQQTLLLGPPPRNVPGLQVAALSIPSQQIDGDFYDFFVHEDQSLDVIVADVMGKGIPAALLAAATKSELREALGHLIALAAPGTLPEPREIVTLVHAEMVDHLIALESFVTLCYVRVDRARRRVSVVDCGHTGLIHVHGRTGACETVHGGNLPLGVRRGEIHDQVTVPFEPGDLFLLYSDGITEATSPAGELFEAERLEACVREHHALAPDALVQAVRASVLAFAGADRLGDDLTCVAVRVGDVERPLARAQLEIRSDLRDLRRARDFVRAFCARLPRPPLEEDHVAALELAVDEAASNVMKHAYHGRVDQRISLEAEAFPDRILVRLHHLGERFDPAGVPPPALDGSRESGFGVYLISRSVDDVRYYRDERGRNCITLVKLRPS
jgi:PAS domain S-box-containing protein